ncbi:MAG: Rrf2 family transcriptional regulator [Bryobacteraceae bacterium]
MKLSAQEEYGMRCLLHLARVPKGQTMTIPEISSLEGLSVPNVAKIMRMLRMGGLVQSERGQAGGYSLARPAEQVYVSEVVDLLGGRFFSEQFCARHSGRQNVCAHSVDCSLRMLWNTVNSVLREVLGKTTLKDLLCSESDMASWLTGRGLVTPQAMQPQPLRDRI